jgi:hypothetical protein
MLRLVMTLPAGYQSADAIRQHRHPGHQGGRGLPGEPPLAVTGGRVAALYPCANHHQTVVPFTSTAKVPRQWGVYQLRPARRERPAESSAAECVPDDQVGRGDVAPGACHGPAQPGRRRPLDGRITPPQGPSGGDQGRLDGRAVARAGGLISFPDPPD